MTDRTGPTFPDVGTITQSLEPGKITVNSAGGDGEFTFTQRATGTKTMFVNSDGAVGKEKEEK